jgi:hypothetical protein
VSLDQQLPPFPGQPGYPVAPQPRRTSGLAIAGLILAFLVAPLGFLVSLIAVFRTGAGRAKGRGLAIFGMIVSVAIMALVITLIVVLSKKIVSINEKTAADPGCVAGKSAVLNGAKNPSADSLKGTIGDLDAAAAKAKISDVRDAMKALADDYNTLLTGAASGNVPAGLQAKITTDGNQINLLCSYGN